MIGPWTSEYSSKWMPTGHYSMLVCRNQLMHSSVWSVLVNSASLHHLVTLPADIMNHLVTDENYMVVPADESDKAVSESMLEL